MTLESRLTKLENVTPPDALPEISIADRETGEVFTVLKMNFATLPPRTEETDVR